MTKFTYVSLFSGIGGFETALNRLGGECVLASEIDKYANAAYEVLYGHPTAGDVTRIPAEAVPDHDVLVGGFPCQAFSVAGKRLGFDDTRGTLFFEIARIARAKRPKLMLLENVKGLVSHDGGKTLDTIALALNEIGYAIDFRILNSKHFGVPQNRERIFIVAARDMEHAEWSIPKKKDVVDRAKERIQALGVKTFNFDWPTNDTVTTSIRDILEENVDEKYYLSDEKTATLLKRLTEETLAKSKETGSMLTDTGLSREIVARKEITPPLRVGGGGDAPGIWLNEPQQYSYEGEGVSYCLDANYTKGTSPGDVGKGRRTHVIEEYTVIQKTHGCSTTIKQDVTGTLQAARLDKVPMVVTGSATIEKVGHLPSDSGQTGAVYGVDGISPTVLNQHGNAVVKVAEEIRAVLTPEREEKRQQGRRFKEDGEPAFTVNTIDRHGIAIGRYPRYRIRKLTPLECFRLQGFPDAYYFDLKKALISDSQLYKMAGNAVTVNVISAIGGRLLPLLSREVAPTTSQQEAV